MEERGRREKIRERGEGEENYYRVNLDRSSGKRNREGEGKIG